MKNIILVGTGIVGLFLGLLIARVIGIADGLGMVIGMAIGATIGMNFLIPYFEKRNKEEPKDN